MPGTILTGPHSSRHHGWWRIFKSQAQSQALNTVLVKKEPESTENAPDLKSDGDVEYEKMQTNQQDHTDTEESNTLKEDTEDVEEQIDMEKRDQNW